MGHTLCMAAHECMVANDLTSDYPAKIPAAVSFSSGNVGEPID
jgi:hypothetical protein